MKTITKKCLCFLQVWSNYKQRSTCTQLDENKQNWKFEHNVHFCEHCLQKLENKFKLKTFSFCTLEKKRHKNFRNILWLKELVDWVSKKIVKARRLLAHLVTTCYVKEVPQSHCMMITHIEKKKKYNPNLGFVAILVPCSFRNWNI